VPNVTAEALDDLASARLGITALREEQHRAIRAAARGRDALVVMPTGGGKSAVYQLTGELRSGPTIVVSPLLALQHDQVLHIEDSRLSSASAANSLQSQSTFDAVLDRFERGDLEFLFVAPEQLGRAPVLERLTRARPSLFVVDEAHCISTWGHDFRPDYLALADAVSAVGRPPVLALTASAAPPVRDEIVERLRLDDPVVVVASFDRPEIDLTVQRFVDEDTKRRALVDDARAWNGPAIVYTATRRATETMRDALLDAGIDAASYHGGENRKERHRVHEAFLHDDIAVVVATNAFGMGIDKANVRVVAHLDVPGSVDAYYQEIGRAGRDGEAALAVLYYRPEDLGVQRFFKSARVDEQTLSRVLTACRGAPTSVDELARRSGTSRGRTRNALDRLAMAGAVTHGRRGWSSAANDPALATARALEVAEQHERTELSRVEMMRAYAETTGCRRVLLLGYYGERTTPPCGRCDVCRRRDTRQTRTGPFAVGLHVEHAEFGGGVVMMAGDDRVTVFFRTHGYRVLATDLVAQQDLLVPATA
jgi:ATP-dependent DNA helicase RecQ